MKTSCKWLQEYVELPWAADELAETLTMAGLEVEGIERLNELPSDVVVARIVSRQPHPNADRLSVCTVDDGSGEPRQVVCGAPNCDAGKKAVLARVGVTLPGGMTLKKAKIRDVASFGMLCAMDELGLGKDHSGIIILPDNAPVGTPYADYLGTDTVIDWEVTPNRPDWLSHFGIAREIGALTGKPAVRPELKLNEAAGTEVHALAKVIVEDPALCPRYTARVIRNVTIGPSPRWLQDKLRAVGLRPINNVVDITNFIMMELGQPLHAFDYDDVAEHTIIVRRAADGERMTTLDDQPHELASRHLVIADARRAVALAGIMGGQNSEISAKTTSVLLESAAFNPANIRATAKQLGVASDSSYRFERGVDIEAVEYASARAAQLICECAGGELAKGVIDVRAKAYEPPLVTCRYQRAQRLLGVDVDPGTIVGIMRRLGLDVVDQDDLKCTVAVPSFRLDLEREADLIEEIARIHGLNNIPTVISKFPVGGLRATDSYYPIQEARRELLGLGLNECLSNNFINEAAATNRTGFTADELVRLANPISNDFNILRPTLLPLMLGSVARNIARDTHDLRFFELGRTFAHRPGLPEERIEVCIAISGRRNPERFSAEAQAEADFYDLRGVLEDWLAARRLTGYQLAKASHPAFRPGTCAEIAIDGTAVAVLGEIHASLVADMRIKHPLFVALVQLDRLRAVPTRPKRFAAMPQFPSTTRDIAFIADEALENQAVLDAVASLRLDHLIGTRLFDIFRDEQAVGAGRKSMAYSFTFRHPERTLTDKEVNQAYERLRLELPKLLPIDMR